MFNSLIKSRFPSNAF